LAILASNEIFLQADLGLLWKDFTEQRLSNKKRKLRDTILLIENESGEDYFPMQATGAILDLGLKKYHNHPDLIVAKANYLVKTEDWVSEDIFNLVKLMGESYGTSNSCCEDFCSQMFMSFMLDPSRRSPLEKLVELVEDRSLKERLTILYLKHLAQIGAYVLM